MGYCMNISNLEILDNRSSILYIFERIPKGSQELYLVNGEGFYIVKHGEQKMVVGCWSASALRVHAPID